MFIRNGSYRGAIFRFEVDIPKKFPLCDRPPKFYFKTAVFHSAVDPQTYNNYHLLAIRNLTYLLSLCTPLDFSLHPLLVNNNSVI
ncbi:unnamed protein product [Soboliphyme baturini]|uniref:UBIQUITIN_CONJUGAT_2 domain-containing protein n=1 Tax=Soboliphyme baturini TaxID=241478 RepID=A0A183IME9_9BILA|nr:unnamed protein product [Soboliphyme baturini]